VQGGGENETSENSNGSVKEVMSNTEVVTKDKRKRFTAAEKLDSPAPVQDRGILFHGRNRSVYAKYTAKMAEE